ncbi:hypothetical protein NDU88_002079 [Pleurodeles waltl]|uniref:Uncharacterized protein n=1 Tax=Pleurodeles waltl TaxID=8319 RepID=A0AAV7M2X5_PLEWA|nr:hypothetical protein NDU88_002079 [Pleurodeles waltl]
MSDEDSLLAQDEVTHLVRYATARVYGEGECPSAALATFIRHERGMDEVLSVMDEGRAMRYATARVYKEGECPSAALATFIRHEQGMDEVLSVMDEGRAMVYGTLKVLVPFRAYSADLYKSRISYNKQATTD